METHELSVLEEKIEKLVQYCQRLREENASLNRALQEKTGEAESLSARLAEYDEMTQNVRERISTLVHTIEELERTGTETGEPQDTSPVQHDLLPGDQSYE